MRAAVVTLSDKASVGLRADASGPTLRDLLLELGAEVREPLVIPDDQSSSSRRWPISPTAERSTWC